MDVKTLRDEIEAIHKSGDCGLSLSTLLHMANTLCEQQSDLEIVQKALELTSSSMEVDSHGYYWIYSSEYGEAYMHGPHKESLLTWAKQTIGDQS